MNRDELRQKLKNAIEHRRSYENEKQTVLTVKHFSQSKSVVADFQASVKKNSMRLTPYSINTQ